MKSYKNVKGYKKVREEEISKEEIIQSTNGRVIKTLRSDNKRKLCHHSCRVLQRSEVKNIPNFYGLGRKS